METSLLIVIGLFLGLIVLWFLPSIIISAMMIIFCFAILVYIPIATLYEWICKKLGSKR